MRTIIQYLALFSLMLVVGVYWGPWLALHRSIHTLSLAELVHLSTLLAQNLGASMGVLLPLSLGSMSGSVWLRPLKGDPSFYWMLLAIGFVLASLGISVGIELPIVNQMKTWSLRAHPANWEALLDNWVYFTVVRMATGLLAFAFISAAFLRPVKPTPIQE